MVVGHREGRDSSGLENPGRKRNFTSALREREFGKERSKPSRQEGECINYLLQENTLLQNPAA